MRWVAELPFVERSHQPGYRLWLATPGRYAMADVLALLRWLEGEPEGGGEGRTWGELVERDVGVRADGLELTVTCSFADVFVTRVAGNKRRFDELCERVRAAFVVR